ncbi:MAG: hypothetical protein QM820_44155 [Minicystis sp.]
MLVAFASALAGCVATTTESGDEAIEQASADLASVDVGAEDGEDEEVGEEGSTRASNTVTTPANTFDGSAVMGEPEPVPWNGPPRTEQGTSSRGR